jgi:hypothetical protein
MKLTGQIFLDLFDPDPSWLPSSVSDVCVRGVCSAVDLPGLDALETDPEL